MAKKKQKQKQVQLTKEQRLELKLKLDVRKALPGYIEHRIEKENKIKEEIIASGEKYYGVLSVLEEQLQNILDDTYWGEDTTAGIEAQLTEL